MNKKQMISLCVERVKKLIPDTKDWRDISHFQSAFDDLPRCEEAYEIEGDINDLFQFVERYISIDVCEWSDMDVLYQQAYTVIRNENDFKVAIHYTDIKVHDDLGLIAVWSEGWEWGVSNTDVINLMESMKQEAFKSLDWSKQYDIEMFNKRIVREIIAKCNPKKELHVVNVKRDNIQTWEDGDYDWGSTVQNTKPSEFGLEKFLDMEALRKLFKKKGFKINRN